MRAGRGEQGLLRTVADGGAGEEVREDSGEERGERENKLEWRALADEGTGEEAHEDSGEERGERENKPEWSHSAAWARSTLFLRSSWKLKTGSVAVTWGPSQGENSAPDRV